MVYYAIATLHVIVCIIVVLVVLLQSGKGADLAGAFGGGATQTAFGSRGPASFLSKMTTISAIIFMLTSIGLSMIATKSETKSILDNKKQSATQPAKKAPAATQPSMPRETPEQIQKRVDELQKKKQTAPAPAEDQSRKPTPKLENVKQQPAKK